MLSIASAAVLKREIVVIVNVIRFGKSEGELVLAFV